MADVVDQLIAVWRFRAQRLLDEAGVGDPRDPQVVERQMLVTLFAHDLLRMAQDFEDELRQTRSGDQI